MGSGAQVRAQDGLSLSGQVSEEGGLYQPPGSAATSYQLGRALAKAKEDLTPELAVVVDGEADEESTLVQTRPFWLEPSQPNLISLEADSPGYFPEEPAMARLDRAFVKWSSGRLDLKVGLQSFDDEGSNFYSPTDYFNPLPVLAWVRDEPLGSEGINADCFLFDDLSLEASTRWLAGGTEEEVVRLMDQGIGITVTPSFAWLQGRQGAGLQLSGTFPDFQARFEGVDWFDAGGPNQLEWVGALSTVIDKAKFSAQVFQDATGEAWGGLALLDPSAFYLFASVERGISGQWRAQAALVKSTDGGPWLFWPQASLWFDANWKLSFQGQWLIGDDSGPLAWNPGQTGLSGSYLF